MEMNCLFFGESQNAYFKYDELSKCRTLQKPNVPFTDQQFIETKGDPRKLPFFRPKMQNETRILSVDLALLGGKANDATQYMIMSMVPNGDNFIKSVEYLESADGGNTELQAFRTKQLFYDANCDVCVIDTHGNGIGVYDICTKETLDEARNITYPPWVAMNDENKGIIRALDKNAIPVVYSITTSGLSANAILHEMYTYAKVQIERKKVKLLINELDAKEYLIDNYEYMMKPAYEQARMLLPYAQTTRLISELTQMESELKNGYIKLTEPSGKRKDRAMCFFYGLYYIRILESELKKKSQKEDISSMFKSSQVTRQSISPFGNSMNPFGKTGNPFGRR